MTPQIKLLPDPPAPNGINDFPLAPPAKVIMTVPLPDQITEKTTIVAARLEERLTDQKLEFKQQWVRVFSCTITPSTPFSQSEAVSVGVAISVGARAEFAASLGLNISSLVDIGAKMSLSLSADVSLAEVVTKTKVYEVETKEPRASFIWWQLKSTYTVTGHRKVSLLMPSGQVMIVSVDEDFKKPLVCDEDLSISTQFPASVKVSAAVSDLQLVDAV